MERSPEIEALVRRWIEAYTSGDMATTEAALSERDDTFLVGTDPNEEWWGTPTIVAVMGRQLEEMGGTMPFRLEKVRAWCEGTVGWAYVNFVLDIEPAAIPGRMTAVLHLELGQWKLVHALSAQPVSAAETLGFDITTSVDLLAQAVEVERPDLRSATAPDGTVTVLFTDIEGSTERNAVLGDRVWMAMLRRHHDLVREQVAANDGYEVKAMGDGFMLAFSSARRALQCAIDIQRAVEKEPELDIAIRAGLHAGEAVRLGDDFYGGVVNMAARVAGAAAGGEVLVSSLVKALVESSGDFAFEAPRQAELKGIAGFHDLHPVLL